MSTQTLALIGALTGVVGALTGALALARQQIAHRRSGRLVSVTTSYMIPVYGLPHAPEFRDDDQVAITVSNRGGAPVTVLNYGVAMGRRTNGTNMFVVDRHPSTAQLPQGGAAPGIHPVSAPDAAVDPPRAPADNAGVKVEVLGPLLLSSKHISPRERATLAAMVVRRGRFIDADELAEAIWGRMSRRPGASRCRYRSAGFGSTSGRIGSRRPAQVMRCGWPTTSSTLLSSRACWTRLGTKQRSGTTNAPLPRSVAPWPCGEARRTATSQRGHQRRTRRPD